MKIKITEDGTVKFAINNIIYFEGYHRIPSLSTVKNNQTYTMRIGSENIHIYGEITKIEISTDPNLYYGIGTYAYFVVLSNDLSLFIYTQPQLKRV